MIGGGTFVTTNKKRPGSYINFVSRYRSLAGVAERGIVAVGLPLSWGHEDIKIVSSENFFTKTLSTLGYSYDDLELRPLREIFQNAKKVLLYNLNAGGKKATLTHENLIVKARNVGTRGNDIAIDFVGNIDKGGYTVNTYILNKIVDTQEIISVTDLEDNEFVTFEYSNTDGVPEELTEGLIKTNLAEGLDGQVDSDSHTEFLASLEQENFHVLICSSDDEITKTQYVNFTERMRNEAGAKFITVMHNNKADAEYVINLYNDCTTKGAKVYEGVYYIGGASAGAEIYQSLTNAKYKGELDFNTKLTNAEKDSLIDQGYLFLVSEKDDNNVKTYYIAYDINSFTSYTVEKNEDFRFNQIVRILDQTAIDISNTFNFTYSGKVQNTSKNRKLLKADILALFDVYKNLNAVEEYNVDEIVVEKGSRKDEVIIDAPLTPVSTMNKLYMTVEVV